MKHFSTNGPRDPANAKRPPRHGAVLTAAIAALLVAVAPQTGASTLAEIYDAADRINQQAKVSQAKVEELNKETRSLYSEYKTVLKEIDGLKVYNRQMSRRIAGQQREIAELNDSMGKIDDIQRQVVPLMERMLVGLEQFIANDMPVYVDERAKRLDDLRDILDRPDVAVSEQFSQILRAYQIENELGRTMNAYTGTIEVDGAQRVVEILHVGRVALVYQTSDGAETGFWNKSERRWEVLDDSFQAAVRTGIRMAKQQAGKNLLPIPILVEG